MFGHGGKFFQLRVALTYYSETGSCLGYNVFIPSCLKDAWLFLLSSALTYINIMQYMCYSTRRGHLKYVKLGLSTILGFSQKTWIWVLSIPLPDVKASANHSKIWRLSF